MLQRITTTPSTAPGRLDGWRRGLLTGASSALLRYILIIAVLSAVGCLYFLEMNRLSDLHEQIINLRKQADLLEQDNIELTRQWARWNTPSYIEAQAEAAGYTTPAVVIRVESRAAAANAAPAH
ncbi:MAG: hypothetical protein BWY52_00800 [Chloroflexi bacterium ADurb.Bin325]|nr:MAG: hypothetical protein BWY52_00800 [Chloroflexi bacterium ADurb.Bin325]